MSTTEGTTMRLRKKCFRKNCHPRWTCRACKAKCCEHRCGLKRNDGTAMCPKCQAES